MYHLYIDSRVIMQIYCKYRTLLVPCTLLGLLILLMGCDLSGTTSSAVSSTTSQSQGRAISPTVIANTKVGTNTPGTGPIIIQSPTPVPGGNASSQQIGLTDRTLVIESVSRQANNTTGTTTITVKLMVKNTSGKNIENLATSYQLVGAEGDMFGLPSGTNGSFFGTIASGGTRSGTLAFQQIPTAAIKKLQLLYRSESAQVVFVPLNA
jgi:hypothetical protein